MILKEGVKMKRIGSISYIDDIFVDEDNEC